MNFLLRSSAFFSIGILIWQAIVAFFEIPPFILPEPLDVFETLWKERELLFSHAIITICEILSGFFIGAFLGFFSAILLAMSPLLCRFFRPILIFTQTIPIFALAPLLTLWFGYGTGSKIAMAVLIIYFPITCAFFDAIIRTPRHWIEMAKLMGASSLRILLYVRIPAALPGFASGLRLSAVYAPIGAIIGEWVGGSEGLGYIMLLSNGQIRTDLMFACLFVLSAMAITLHMFVDIFA